MILARFPYGGEKPTVKPRLRAKQDARQIEKLVSEDSLDLQLQATLATVPQGLHGQYVLSCQTGLFAGKYLPSLSH